MTTSQNRNVDVLVYKQIGMNQTTFVCCGIGIGAHLGEFVASQALGEFVVSQAFRGIAVLTPSHEVGNLIDIVDVFFKHLFI